ncbi:MAG: AAA family ATPase [Methanobrevibacter sp.]|uniref:AAA family ATPase n=1 Tax=Methanobrevibacter sp. TaxID=66852 RepID=UPI0031F4C334|nr:AAA family ATPase [Methanobrevibacter sp.]
MQFSYSKVDCYSKCPHQYKLKYIDKLETLDEFDPQDPLKLGTAIHKGIETDVKTAIEEYYNSYPVIDDRHIEEAIKLEYLIPEVKARLPNGLHEVKVETDDYIGFLDLIVPVGTDNNGCLLYDLYDFKYSNNIDKYMDSKQLHVYKNKFEKANPNKKIRNMYFVFIPKCQIRLKKTEEQYQFRQRIIQDIDTKFKRLIDTDNFIMPVIYDESKVKDYLNVVNEIKSAQTFAKNETKLCEWCKYYDFCNKKEELNMLPKAERVDIAKDNYKKLWIYGAPFSGKTTLADQAPMPINLNTDGNVKYVTMARLPIKDNVTVEGRITKRQFAWEVFKEAVDELEKGSEFKTIVVDLLEDTYEYCRLYMYDKLGITHESDDSFRAWDKVRTEYLSTIKRLLNLPYNIILISHEDSTKDITKKSGDKITSIKPNINDKTANKVAGLVDIVARVVVEDDGTRYLSFKSNEVIFGGGRLQGIKTTEIPLSWEELMKVYETITTPSKVEEKPTPTVEPVTETPVTTQTEEPVRRTRRVRE